MLSVRFTSLYTYRLSGIEFLMHMTIFLCRLLVIWFVERDCLLECVRNYWTDTTSFVTQPLFQSERR